MSPTTFHEPLPEVLESVAQEAHRLVHGDRNDTYGHPYDDFSKTAILWGPILGLDNITPEQVAMCMIQVKISRELNAPKRDNRVDMAGYATTLDRVAQRREELSGG